MVLMLLAVCSIALGQPQRIDINKATAQELMSVKGIGKVIAAKIIAHREKAGGFKSLRELTDVNGIGEKFYLKLACTFCVPEEGVIPCTPATKGTGKGVAKEPVGKVNINTATATQLTALHGIGPKKAELIVAHREANGWFGSPEDLQEIKGFGPKTVEKFKPVIETKVDVNKATAAEFTALGFANAAKILEFRKIVGGFKGLDDLEQVPGTDKKDLRRVKRILIFGSTAK